MENFNPAQIARKMGRDPTTIRRIIDRYKKTRKTENLPRSECPPALNNNKKNAKKNNYLNFHLALHYCNYYFHYQL